MDRRRGAIGGQDVARIGSSALVVNPILPAIERGRNAINGPGGSTFNTLLASDITRVHQAALCSPGYGVFDAVPTR